jgi:holliday junction DNA helicase RuvA
VALAILSALEPADLMRAIASGDKAMVARANGVGPKLAQRIVMELKDKVGGIALAIGQGGGIAPPAGAGADAVSALLNLGFRPAEASAAVASAEEELGAGASLDALVRLALRKAAK